MSNTAFAKTFVWSWFLLCLVLLAAFLAIYFKPYDAAHQKFDHQQASIASTTASASDVIDLSSIVVLDCDIGSSLNSQLASPVVRRCFDQLLYTSQPTSALEQALKQGLASQMSSQDFSAVMQLWQQYHRYFAEFKRLPRQQDDQDQAFAVAILRQKYFRPEQHQGLFGAESPAVQLQLAQHNILMNAALDPVTKARQLSELFGQTTVSTQIISPLKDTALRQLQHELRTSHASAEQVKQVLALLG